MLYSFKQLNSFLKDTLQGNFYFVLGINSFIYLRAISAVGYKCSLKIKEEHSFCAANVFNTNVW